MTPPATVLVPTFELYGPPCQNPGCSGVLVFTVSKTEKTSFYWHCPRCLSLFTKLSEEEKDGDPPAAPDPHPQKTEERFVYVLSVHHPVKRRSRTWGWFRDPSEAFRVIEESPDLHAESGYYRYAIVEKVPEGSHSIAEIIRVYQFQYDPDDPEKCSVVLVPRPEFVVDGVFNFWC